jgi:hypothetical protein
VQWIFCEKVNCSYLAFYGRRTERKCADRMICEILNEIAE